MRKLLPHKNKKAVSEMVSYVFLIVIAIGLSIGVFAYLKIYLPKDRVECNQDVSLMVTDYLCVKNSISGKITLNANVTNNGLFNLSGAYFKLAASGKLRKPINDLGIPY